MKLLHTLALFSFLISSQFTVGTTVPLPRAVTFLNKTGNPVKIIWYSYHTFREERSLPNNTKITAYDVTCQDIDPRCAYQCILEDGQWSDDIPLFVPINDGPQTITLGPDATE